MTITGSALLALALPVLLLGEFLTQRVKFLQKSHIPPPVVSGLLVAVLVLIINEGGKLAWGGAAFKITIVEKVYERWWIWLTTPETEWAAMAKKGVNVY